MHNPHRVLVLSRNQHLRNDLVTLLSGYGYHTDHSDSRSEGMKQFRAYKQSIIIVDVPILRKFSQRIFRMIRIIHRHAIVLVAAHQSEMSLAFAHLRGGAFDVLNLPLTTSELIHTINRAQQHHRLYLENLFVKNVLFFGMLLAPLWILCLFLLFK